MQLKLLLTCTILSAVVLLTPLSALAYAQGYYEAYYQAYYEGYYEGYYQSYYQSYYQAYYQTYYEGSYQTTFTKNVSESGNFAVSGSISKGSGTFVIDDPLDPKNKLLYHSFIESPDVKNLYDGLTVLDSKGEATVLLPAYFDLLNGDVRYQVKPVGASMPNLYIKETEHDNRFVVGGGVAGGQVSWQITGIRHDPYIVANPIVPEVAKGPGQLVDKGQYLFPEGYQSFSIFGWIGALWGKILSLF